MSEMKPLIFIHPLSKTLVQLKEVIEENAEADGIEVFEVESLNEMTQLIPTIGPSVTLISNPRKCAMFLQANNRIIVRMKAKVIMLSPKFIPRKTLEKFMKIALTDCIIEPVAPKTLLYKVKLMLRSLPTDINDKQVDTIVSSEEDEKLGNEDAQHIEKGIAMDGHLKGDVNNDDINLKLEGEEEDDIQTTSEAENKTDGHLRGDLSDSEDDKGGMQEGEGYHENPMGGHYKGSVEQGLNLEEEDEDEEEDDFVKDDLLAQAKEDLNLNLIDIEDEELYEDKKDDEENDSPEIDAPLSLEIEEEKEKNASMEGNNHLAGHLKGKVDNAKLEMEDDSLTEENDETEEGNKEKSPFDDMTPNLELEDDDPEITLEKEEGVKGLMNDKTDPTLTLEDDEDKDQTQVGTDQLNGDLSGEGDKADELDKYYKSDLEQGLKLEDDEEDPSFSVTDDKKGQIKQNDNMNLELDDEPGLKKLDDDNDKFNLELNDDLKLEDEDDNPIDIGGKLNKKGATGDPNLALELEEFKERKKREAEQANKDAKGLLKKKELTLEDEDGETYWKKDDTKGKLTKKDSDVKLELEEEEKEDKIHNHGVDHIQKYMGLKTGDKVEKGADWNALKKKEEVWETQEKIKDTEERELIIPKIDRGEQTIDYRKLKAEFDVSISMDRKASKTDGSIDWNTKKKDKKEGLKLDNPDQDIFDTPLTEEEEEAISQKEPIFEPDSRGLEHVIDILSLYHDNKKDLYTILYKISQKIYDQTKGLTTFFLYNPQTESYKEEFTGHLYIDTDIDKSLRESKWENLKKDRMDTWKLSSLPIWKDSTFQEDNNEFLYPFYQGVSNMGYAVVTLGQTISEKDSYKIEIILESARGGYTDHYAVIEKAMKKEAEEKSGKKKDKKEKKGILGGFFRKKKAS